MLGTEQRLSVIVSCSGLARCIQLLPAQLCGTAASGVLSKHVTTAFSIRPLPADGPRTPPPSLSIPPRRVSEVDAGQGMDAAESIISVMAAGAVLSVAHDAASSADQQDLMSARSLPMSRDGNGPGGYGAGSQADAGNADETWDAASFEVGTSALIHVWRHRHTRGHLPLGCLPIA